MADTPESRADLQSRLASLQQADCIQLVRFRRHTVRSRLGHVADVVADEVFGGDADPIEGRVGRAGEPGVVVVARLQGQDVGRIEVHPLQPDFDTVIVPDVARACARLGAALEVWIEDQPVARKELPKAGKGYRDAAMVDRGRLAAAGWSIAEEGREIRHEVGDPPRLWLAVIIGVLMLACFPITLAAMLFPESREALLGMMRNALRGWTRRWEITAGDGQAHCTLVNTGVPTQSFDFDLRRTVVMTWPLGWSRDSKGRQLALIGDRATFLQCPSPELVEAFLDAHC